MHEELCKLSGGLIFGENTIIVPKQNLQKSTSSLNGHNDHRIVMALAVGATIAKTPVVIEGAEAVRKSYPAFFEDLARLGIDVHVE